ncbi:glycosyltransferase [uncultured Alsobacter sp.]|uniref:glycosyltransferase n=1 Tax=uncultured Alsobacter sp. TaxID=1748258 RepID=UPI0025FCF44F|nr:glycosyltransferase [uncultured Alsobacter sp.]
MTLFVNVNGETYHYPGPRIPLGPAIDENVLEAFDFVVYNIGNNQENHYYINRLAMRYPGVVVVHDLVMQHYVAWEVFEGRRDPTIYADLIANYYGPTGLDIVEGSRICSQAEAPRYAPWDSSHVLGMPLIEPYVASAAAVIVHSDFAEQETRPHTRAPTLRLGLPWDQKQSLTDEEIATWVAKTRLGGSVRFASFGHINRAKCLDLVVRAFDHEPSLRKNATLLIAGYPRDREYTQELVDLVDHLKLKDVVTFEFSVTTERLQEIKIESDVFVNIRSPNTESASGSLIEQLNTGKPIIIYDSGCYAEVPDEAAVKVAPINSLAALAEAMAEIATDADRRIAVGRAGLAHVRSLSSADYVTKLAAFLKRNEADLRRRQKVHAGLRVRDEDEVGGLMTALDPLWLRDLALARRWMAPIVTGAPALSLHSFLLHDDVTLRRFITLGVFRMTSRPQLEAVVDDLVRRLDRPTLFRVVRQARAALDCLAAFDATGEHRPPTERVASETLALLGSFGPQLLARALYVLVLGRAPSREEAGPYALRLSTGETVAAVVREFLASNEFRNRGMSEIEVAEIRAGAERLSVLDFGTPAGQRLLRVGEKLSFTSGSGFPRGVLAGDWFEPEEDGVWSQGPLAALSLCVATGRARFIGVAVEYRLAGLPGMDPRRLRIFVNGQLTETLSTDAMSWRTLEFTVPTTEDQTAIQLVIDSERPVRMSDFGTSDDSRTLGVLLRSVVLMDPDTSGEGDQPLAAPVLALGTPVRFTKANPPPANLLRTAWHAVEQDGVWSRAQVAKIAFRAPPEAEGPLEGRILARLIGTAASGPRRVSIFVNHTVAATQIVATDEPIILTFPLPAPDPEGSTYQVSVECDRAPRPVDLGLSSDTRRLGICLNALELVPQRPASQRPAGQRPARRAETVMMGAAR